MSKQGILAVLFVFFLVAWVGCGGCFGESDDEAETPTAHSPRDRDEDRDEDRDRDGDEPESIADALKQAENALKEITADGEEPVDFRELKALLPEDLDDMERVSAEGQKSGAFGIKVSEANAEYEGDDGEIQITIVDLGTLKGLAKASYAFWLTSEVDRETDRGYEKTTTYKDFPAYEKVERDDHLVSCNFGVFVGERFIVTIEGTVEDEERCEDAREEVNYRKLERMEGE